MSARAVVAWLLLAITAPVVAQAAGRMPVDLQLDPAEAISAYELAHSLTPQALVPRQTAGVAQVFALDPESAPVQGHRALVAIVLVGNGDVGEAPVAVRIQARGLRYWPEVSERYLQRHDRIVLFFHPEGCLRDDSCLSGLVAVPIRFDADTGRVRIGGRAPGAVAYTGQVGAEPLSVAALAADPDLCSRPGTTRVRGWLNTSRHGSVLSDGPAGSGPTMGVFSIAAADRSVPPFLDRLHADNRLRIVADARVECRTPDRAQLRLTDARSAPLEAAAPEVEAAIVLLTSVGRMRAQVTQGAEDRRRLTVECIADCTADSPRYSSWIDDAPVSMIRLSDSTNGFCLLAMGGSSYHFTCYAVGADVRVVLETGFRELVSISHDEIVGIGFDGELRVSLRGLFPAR